jgi:hypothetical protein
MKRVSWIGLSVASIWAVAMIAIQFPFWMAIIMAAIGYWQGHSFSRQLSKGSPDPNLFLRNFFSAPGEKSHYKKLAVYWFIVMNIIGLLMYAVFHYNPPFTTTDLVIGQIGLVLTIVPPGIFLILSAKKS